MVKKVYIGSDHGGYSLKEQLKGFLLKGGYVVEDLGAHILNPEDDYPDFIIPVAQKVVADPKSLGIILGRSGNGEAMVANKVKGVRAAVCFSEQMAKKAKLDNNANILSLGADFVNLEQAKKVVNTFLDTPFSSAERHIRRLQKIEALER